MQAEMHDAIVRGAEATVTLRPTAIDETFRFPSVCCDVLVEAGTFSGHRFVWFAADDLERFLAALSSRTDEAALSAMSPRDLALRLGRPSHRGYVGVEVSMETRLAPGRLASLAVSLEVEVAVVDDLVEAMPTWLRRARPK